MRSENTLFVGGPLDGRVLPVLTGLTGRPPKWYDVPVPNGDGGPVTVYAYRRTPAGFSRRLGVQLGWKYAYAPEGHVADGPRWPWTRRPLPEPRQEPPERPERPVPSERPGNSERSEQRPEDTKQDQHPERSQRRERRERPERPER